MKYYLCKYIPPRADFLPTMTGEEKALMKQHGDYMNQLLADGLIVAHGPVLDPAGGYGVSIYQVEDGADMKALTSADPIVAAGIGHYEIHPMPQLKVRG